MEGLKHWRWAESSKNTQRLGGAAMTHQLAMPYHRKLVILLTPRISLCARYTLYVPRPFSTEGVPFLRRNARMQM